MGDIQYLDLAKIYGAVDAARSNAIQNRIAEMQFADYQKKLETEGFRDSLAARYLQAAQPQQGTPAMPQQGTVAPSDYAGLKSEQPNQLYAAYMMGGAPPEKGAATPSPMSPDFKPAQAASPDYSPAQPTKMDWEGYQKTLLQRGDVQGAMAIDEKIRAQRADYMKEVVSLAAINPEAAVKMWNSGPLSQLGQVTHIGGDTEMQYFQNPKTGAISGIPKKQPIKPDGTPNLIVFDKGRQEDPNLTREQLTAKALKGDKEAKAILDEMDRRTIATTKEKKAVTLDSSGALSPEATTQAATRYRMTGEMPALGTGGARVKMQILNEAAKQAKAEGQTAEEQALNKAAYKAGAAELSKIQQQRGLAMSFEKTANKNFDLVLNLSDKVDRSGSTLFNKWAMYAQGQIGSDPDILSFEAAIKSATNEYAKVVTGQTGGAAVSDAARKETEKMLSAAYSKEAFKKVISTMKMEMENRKKGYDEQISELKTSMGGGDKATTGTGATNKTLPSNAKVVNGTTYYNINGKWYAE